MTQPRRYASARPVGRKKQYTERLTLPIDKQTLDRLDAVRGADEVRLDVIRDAIDRELKRRERQQPAPPKPECDA